MSTPHPPSSTTPPDTSDGDKDDAVGWLLMEQCWSECGEQLQSGGCAVRFIQDPYSSLLVFQSSSSYITINGNEESCGSSFADSGTSFMATLHSTTPSLHHHSSPSLSANNFNPVSAADDDTLEDEFLSTFLGLRGQDHHQHHHEHDEQDDLFTSQLISTLKSNN